MAWYTWLEQGRVVATSAQVIDSLARALQFDDAHRHLRRLAGLPLPPVPIGDSAYGAIAEPLRRMLGNLLPNPAYIMDRRFDFLAWNRAYSRVWRDLAEVPDAQRNLVWLLLTDQGLRRLIVGWENRATCPGHSAACRRWQLPGRRAHRQASRRSRSRQPEFRDWRPRYTVGRFTDPEHSIDHPEAGKISFDLAQLSIPHHPALILVLQTPVTDAGRATLARLVEGQ